MTLYVLMVLLGGVGAIYVIQGFSLILFSLSEFIRCLFTDD